MITTFSHLLLETEYNAVRVINQRNKQCFSVLRTVFEHDSVVSSTQKNFRARDAVECSNVFLSAENNPGVLKNSTEHAETLFIVFRQFPQVNSIQLTTVYWALAFDTKSNWSQLCIWSLGLLTINLAPVS